jgi:hypothetical protein
MLDLEVMELQYEPAVANQALVFVSSVPAITGEQILVPPTTPRDVCN